jgi:uncharacterized membrane protein YphA (DoxX/SURF4 family)
MHPFHLFTRTPLDIEFSRLVFNPPIGPTVLFFAGFPSARFFQALNALEIVATVFLLAGYWTRVASFSLAILLFIGNCWAFSFGKINHDIFMILIPLVMTFSNWEMPTPSTQGRLKSDFHAAPGR